MHRRSAPPRDFEAQVETIRQFNRFFTQRIGVLDESLLDSGLTLTQARVLFEIGTSETCTAGDLISLLRLDAGYLSRILQEFVDSRLVKRSRHPMMVDEHCSRSRPRDGRNLLSSIINRVAASAN